MIQVQYVPDGDEHRTTLKDLKAGECFQYKKGDTKAVYMMVAGEDESVCVDLKRGALCPYDPERWAYKVRVYFYLGQIKLR